jgi:SAM-dependent methyltransferase
MWDERFAAPGYLFGTEPAEFLRRHARHLPPAARVLSVAEGEGRNAVFLARLGHAVTGFDASPVGIAKARALAAEAGVAPDLHQADLDAWDWTPAAFVQFAPPAQRARLFAGIDRTLRPGGLLLLHGYAPRQIANGTGGPRAVENLYTLDLLREAFPGYAELAAADYDAELREGEGHAGRSALIDFVARKPG